MVGLGLGLRLRKRGGGAAERAPKAFVSAGDGNVNSIATWTDGVDYPRLPADTVTVAAGHEITVPSGFTWGVGAIALNAGLNTTTNRTKIKINGTLNMGGDLALATITSIEMGAGSIIDLKGFNVTQSATDVKTILAGNSGSHVTVRSTGGRGAWFPTSQNLTTATWDYVDCDGLAASNLGRAHGAAAPTNHYDHCTFNDMSDWYIDRTNVSANAGIVFTNNDVRNAHSANAIQAGIVLGGQALGSGTRVFTGNTFNGGSLLGSLLFSGVVSLTFEDNIIVRHFINVTGNNVTLNRNMMYNITGEDTCFFASGSLIPAITGDYFYHEGGNHVFGSSNTTVSAIGNVFEVPQVITYAGMNWFLYSTASVAITLQNNIWLGAGTPLSITGASAPTIDISGNTGYVNNFQTISPNFGDFGIFETEQVSALSGTFNYYNNLVVVPNTHPGGGAAVTNPHISLRNAVGSQVTSANFNGKAGYDNAGAYDAAVVVGYWENRGGGQIAGLGVNDVAADPLFVDKSRALATWDTSLGGAGTAAHAIAEMLKLNGYGGAFNSSYGLAALLTYVKAGFQPSGAGATAYNGTGLAGANIGFR